MNDTLFDSWHGYPKVFAMGHSAIEDLFKEEVICEEKVDGSQFSFGLFPEEENSGVLDLRVRSKGCVMLVDAPQKMFQPAVDTVKAIKGLLVPGWTYRCEAFFQPKHNALHYDRVPKGNIILFDVNTGNEKYLSRQEKEREAERLGLEVVPMIHFGRVDSIEFFRSFLDKQSVLGGQKVEGVIAKNYVRFGRDGKCLMGKFVSEAFKETHSREWKSSNPSAGDITLRLADEMRSPARWQKAVLRLRESGQIEWSPRDIGKLIPMIHQDVLDEETENIKQKLFDWAKGHIIRKSTGGFPEWYKEQLLARQFEIKGDDK